MPAGETHQTHDLVDVVDHALDHHRRLGIAGLLKQLGERRLAAVFVLFRRGFFLGFDQLARQFEQFLEEGDAVQLPGLVALLERFQPLGQSFEARIAQVLAPPRGDLDLDFLRVCS